MKERINSKKKNDIFSPKNLLIFFATIIVLLFALTYFNPAFSGKNKNLSPDSEIGELYQLVPVVRKPCPLDGSGDLTCHSECEICFTEPVFYVPPRPDASKCVPKSPLTRQGCTSNHGDRGICIVEKDPFSGKEIGKCSECPEKCGVCQVCKPAKKTCWSLFDCPVYEEARCVFGGEETSYPDVDCEFNGGPGMCFRGKCFPEPQRSEE